MPAIAGHQREAGEQLLRAGRDREVHAIGRREVGDLLGGALVQVQLDLGVLLAEALDDRRQHVTRLRVRRRDGHRAAFLVLEIGREAPDVLCLLEDADRALDDLLAGLRDAREIAAFALEDLEAELVLEQLDLLADTGLRGVQRPRGGRDVEAVLHDGGEVAELV